MTRSRVEASRKPRRQAFSLSRLNCLLQHVLRSAWDPSTRSAYRSHLRSYSDFVLLHHLPFEPNPHTLALYIVFMSQHIKPTSVEGYLTGIIHSLLPFYPHIIEWRTSLLVRQALKGCKKLYNKPVIRKRPLTLADLERVSAAYITRPSHDDSLFLAQLLIGFYGLLRLGELCYSDNLSFDSPNKMPRRDSLHLSTSQLEFTLPYHKADHFFEGNQILIFSNSTSADPVAALHRYLLHRDHHFPSHRDLWVRANGARPRRSWFLKRLREFFDYTIAGQSLRSGGATALAERGTRLELIQGIGRWASDAFRIYIRRHPLLLHNAISHTKS